jgi:hypothetical protein
MIPEGILSNKTTYSAVRATLLPDEKRELKIVHEALHSASLYYLDVLMTDYESRMPAHEILERAFIWSESPQGNEYWAGVRDRLKTLIE